MKKLLVTNVLRVAHNDEVVTLENDQMKVTINLKDSELHGQIEKGVEVEDLFENKKMTSLESSNKKLKKEVADLKKQVEELTLKLEEAATKKVDSGKTE